MRQFEISCSRCGKRKRVRWDNFIHTSYEWKSGGGTLICPKCARECKTIIIGDIEEIRRGYGVDNADADNAFADLCGNYCSNNGHRCYEESEKYRCKHFKWRGLEGRKEL